MSAPAIAVRHALVSHPGKVRRNNEDAALAQAPIFLVADGMGGHAHGEQASAQAVAAFSQLLDQQWVRRELLSNTVALAAEQVQALATGAQAPGTTITGVALSLHGGMPCWLVFNIGDSRVYLLRAGQLRQLSVDHTAGQAGFEGSPHAITRALGAGVEHPIADEWLLKAHAGDRLLICSDGLTRELNDGLLRASLAEIADPQGAAEELLELALAAGGHDNITLIVLDCLQAESQVADLSDDTPDYEEAEATVIWEMSEPPHMEGG